MHKKNKKINIKRICWLVACNKDQFVHNYKFLKFYLFRINLKRGRPQKKFKKMFRITCDH